MRFFAGAVIGAAVIAACLNVGLEALYAPQSETTAHQGEISLDRAQEAIAAEPPASGVFLRDAVHGQNATSFSNEANTSSSVIRRSFLWNKLILFGTELLGSENRSFRGASSPQARTQGDAVALPRPRPPGEPAAPPQIPSAAVSAGEAVVPQSSPAVGFFQKLFQFGTNRPVQFPAEASGRTAVYDIETRAVYLPTGEILEAHSGLREHMDDVRYVQEKSRGPTPPNVYALSLRQRPFHGVQAIRLTPANNSAMFGRAGILAHPYMLGPSGDSNGCVSIQNYEKFLQAYLKGQIDQIIVVPRLAATREILNASGLAGKRLAAYGLN